jgi:hypothetical protein
MVGTCGPYNLGGSATPPTQHCTAVVASSLVAPRMAVPAGAPRPRRRTRHRLGVVVHGNDGDGRLQVIYGAVLAIPLPLKAHVRDRQVQHAGPIDEVHGEHRNAG